MTGSGVTAANIPGRWAAPPAAAAPAGDARLIHQLFEQQVLAHPDAPAQKIRHPRNVRILPPSRDFH